jgi:hypothetical protein
MVAIPAVGVVAQALEARANNKGAKRNMAEANAPAMQTSSIVR